MEYTNAGLFFRIKKVLRYIQLYGLSRTLIKVQGQYHMRKKLDKLPRISKTVSRKQNVALIGCGNYAFSNIAYYLNKNFGKVIAGCLDTSLNRAASLARKYRVPVFTEKLDDLPLDKLKLVYIASNHASHAEYAIRCLKSKIDVYIEKPHVVNENQLFRLTDAIFENPAKVFLGFNRPQSKFAEIIFYALAEQPGGGIYNWFVVGHQIPPDHWYFNKGEGGRVLGNLCHWTDFTLKLISPQYVFPIEIIPARQDKPDSDLCVTYKFNEGSMAVITFSEKGETFEGVREKFNAQKGNCLISMQDFQNLTIEVGARKKKFKNFYRDQGHQKNIVRAYSQSVLSSPYQFEKEVRHLCNSAWLFLKTRQALEENATLKIDSFESIYPDFEQKMTGIVN